MAANSPELGCIPTWCLSPGAALPGPFAALPGPFAALPGPFGEATKRCGSAGLGDRAGEASRTHGESSVWGVCTHSGLVSLGSSLGSGW
jgi:hypothetical protein